ncbi:MBL fold metallo-hydrolase [Bacillus sp. 1P06AnD]|uniref:MBL fold metallo-hydrolase n=1 Tax=Bacillus sp. 1P06AnD TaxID=3132208 RepID=UPI0039A30EB9
MKISKVNVLICTHPEADHIGGLDEVIGAFPNGTNYLKCHILQNHIKISYILLNLESMKMIML